MVMFNADKMNELREKYVIAEGVSSRIALERVQLVLANWNKRIPFCLFSRGANSYKYDEYLKQVCLTKNPYEVRSPEKSRRMYDMLRVVEHALDSDTLLRLRLINYLYPDLFDEPELDPARKVERISDTINDLCMLLQVTRECLNVYASPNGLISGPLLLFCEGKLLADCSLGGSSGCLIPSEVIKVDAIEMKSKIDFVLVVEKDTIFHFLSDHDFHKRNNCVLITGRG